MTRRDRRRVPWLAGMVLLAACTPVRDPLNEWIRAVPAAAYRAPNDDEARSVAEALSAAVQGEVHPGWSALGYDVMHHADEVAVRERAPALRGWGSYRFRSGVAHGVVIQAPHVRTDLHTGEIALGLYHGTHARLLALSAVHRELPDADQANVSGSPLALLGAAAAVQDLMVVQVHGFGEATARRHGLPEDGLVLSNGTRLPDAGLQRVAGCLRTAGFDVRVFPETADSLGATRNAVRLAMAATGRVRFIHIELGGRLRKDMLANPQRLQELAQCL